MREFLNPPKLSTPSCFMLPPNHDHVTIRPQVVSQLPIFRGTKNENPLWTPHFDGSNAFPTRWRAGFLVFEKLIFID